MGKPAARIGDLTAHGGTVTVGKPTVLIGKMPASTMGDMHVCPMVTGVVPHVGGPITLGSVGVLICKVPAARVSDITVCVGPPSMPAMGCFTVLIGEAGGGGGGSGAASAAAAASASKNGPKAIKPFDPGQPPEPRTENHWVECQVVDSAGMPLGGLRYKLKDPDGKDIVGSTSPEGRIRHDGYAQAGSFKVEFPSLANAKWSKAKARPGDKLTLKCDADGFKDGAAAAVLIFEEREGGRRQRVLATLRSKVDGKKVEAEWTLGKEDYPSDTEEKPDGKSGGKTEYFFFVEAEGLIAVSERAIFADDTEIKLVDEDGKAIPDTAYEMRLHDGTVRKGKVDKDGKAQEKDVPVGAYVIVLPEIIITGKVPKGAKGSSPRPSGGAHAPHPAAGADAHDDHAVHDDADHGVIDFLYPLPFRPGKGASYKSGGLKFGADREDKEVPEKDKHGNPNPRWKRIRTHAGCDLLAPEGTDIYAVKDGKVVRGPYSFYHNNVQAIEVDHGDFLVRYGEVKDERNPPVKEGDTVKQGQVIAHVGKMNRDSMLHFEMYSKKEHGKLSFKLWELDDGDPEIKRVYRRRPDLINPAPFLDKAILKGEHPEHAAGGAASGGGAAAGGAPPAGGAAPGGSASAGAPAGGSAGAASGAAGGSAPGGAAGGSASGAGAAPAGSGAAAGAGAAAPGAASGGAAPGGGSSSAAAGAKPPLVDPPWISIARAELGVKEIKGKEHNPRVVEYHASTKKKPDTDEVPWCSSFVNWVIEKAGYAGTKSSWAKDWKNWGKKNTKPAFGCIAVIDHGKDDAGKDKGGHVGFVVGKKKDRLVLLGGNQSDQVCYSLFKQDKMIAFVLPTDYAKVIEDLPEIKSVNQVSSYAATR